MAKITDRYLAAGSRPVLICDFSPPRSGDPEAVAPAGQLNVDFVSVAYNPGRSVRADPVAVAYQVRRATGRDVVFTLGTRDRNKVAIQTALLGAQMLGLENVIVVRGDPFTARDLELTKAVYDFTPTGLIRTIGEMNEGIDYRGLKLRAPLDLCVGATLDLGGTLDWEAELARRKVESGARFFITQPLFDLSRRDRFLELYEQRAGEPLTPPVFWGLQVLEKEGLLLGDIPESIRSDLDRGRPGTEIALEAYGEYCERGIRGIYLVPPILRGGTRDYAAAQRVVEGMGRRAAGALGGGPTAPPSPGASSGLPFGLPA